MLKFKSYTSKKRKLSISPILKFYDGSGSTVGIPGGKINIFHSRSQIYTMLKQGTLETVETN